jgi:hypothetical protein
MELEEEGVPAAVTLVKPASVDTPLFDKPNRSEGRSTRSLHHHRLSHGKSARD